MPRIIQIDPTEPEPGLVFEAVHVLKGGGVVIFPTDTVYGVGASIHSQQGIERIFQAKKRPKGVPLVLMLHDAEEIREYAARMSPLADKMAKTALPGPLTLVVDKGEAVPDYVTRGLQTVGIRVPNHAVALAILKAAGPLATTSANLSGSKHPLSAEQAIADIGDGVDLVVDSGDSPLGVPSHVIDVRGEHPKVLRDGPPERGRET
jgi:L-threonylcarbamoyladenylate synthase